MRDAAGVSEGTLLGGRVRYAQRESGHRTGIEPVLLAAFVPAAAGERVVEGGTGAGAGLLCLAARVDGVVGVGVEADPGLAALAAANFAANGFEGCRAEVGVIPALPASAREAAHAFANPPWHAPASTPSADAGRRLARQRDAPGVVGAWAAALAEAVVRGGTVSLIVPAALHLEAAAGLEAGGCGGMVLFPLWPRAGAAAKLAMVRGVKGSRTTASVAAGLVLHEADGGFTPAAEDVLRGGKGLGG